MKREINYNGTIIKYELTRKRVKNINLRITPDMKVKVSANSRVSLKYIDGFVLRKADFILSALEKYKADNSKPREPNFEPREFLNFVLKTFDEVYGLFIPYKVKKPELKFRKMKSRWGSCNYSRGTITLSTNLIYCTKEQIYYVIVHEYSHLLVHNHSREFYDIVSRFVPDYKQIRKEMRGIPI